MPQQQRLLGLTIIAATLLASCSGKQSQAPLYSPHFNLLDTDQNGNLTLKEYRASGANQNEFHLLDFNGDGLLTRQEFDNPFAALKSPRQDEFEKERQALEKQIKATRN